MDAELRLKFKCQRQRVQVVGQDDVEFATRQRFPRRLNGCEPVVDTGITPGDKSQLVRGPAAGVTGQCKVFIHSLRGFTVATRRNAVLAFEQLNLLEDPWIRTNGRKGQDQQRGELSHGTHYPRHPRAIRSGNRLRALPEGPCGGNLTELENVLEQRNAAGSQ